MNSQISANESLISQLRTRVIELEATESALKARTREVKHIVSPNHLINYRKYMVHKYVSMVQYSAAMFVLHTRSIRTRVLLYLYDPSQAYYWNYTCAYTLYNDYPYLSMSWYTL